MAASFSRGRQFLSTPSARRATLLGVVDTAMMVKISIHALREEGDARFPPFANVTENISIHALREEGDS